MTGQDVRAAFLAYMEEKGHAIIPSSPLVPENDPTTLFTGSGMQPLVPYLMGETHPQGTRLADSQKCFRAEDIEEVGDNRHTTFFEMLGNWSLGDYFKDEQISWVYEFLTEKLQLNPENIYVTTFIGDEANNIPKDEKSAELWAKLFEEKGVSHGVADMGSEEDAAKRGMQDDERIFYYNAKKNWWSRAGVPENMPEGEIGGPDTEMFYDFGTEHDPAYGEHCHPNCDCGRFIEIGNSVFMEYIKQEDGSFEQLPKQNVDFGGGLERLAAATNHDADVFKVDVLWNSIEKIQELSGTKYEENQLAFRVIADHMRGAVFMIGDGVNPSNTEQGYFVRRLLRRAIRYADTVSLPSGTLSEIAGVVIEIYASSYPNLIAQKDTILETIQTEETQFRKTLEKGMREFEKMSSKGTLSGEDAFILFTTHGFPFELTEELAQEQGISLDKKAFDNAMEAHQARSRAGAEQKFKGGLADNSEQVVMYHTATHLLLAALRKELGDHVHQAGSNITSERMRFDFTHDEKVSREVLDKIEVYVNDAIQKGAKVTIETLPKEEAHEDDSIEGSFWEKYPDTVKVYTIADDEGTIYSRELCGGPHVENTEAIKGTFKIKKEESSARGIRRIKAVLE